MTQLQDRAAEDDVASEKHGPATHSAVRRPRQRMIYLAAGLAVLLAAATVLVFVFVRDGSSGVDTKKATDAVKAGLAAQSKGDLAGAQKQYEKALKYNPKDKVALYDLAVIDYANANIGLAEQRYREVLKIDPRYEPALYNLAIIAQAKGDQQAALSLYQRAVQANPADASAHFNLALMLRSMKYKADGDAQMKIALKLDPSLRDPARASTKPSPKPAQAKASNAPSSSRPSR